VLVAVGGERVESVISGFPCLPAAGHHHLATATPHASAHVLGFAPQVAQPVCPRHVRLHHGGSGGAGFI